MCLRVLILYTSTLLLLLPTQAQTYTAARITFSNPGTFTQQQLEDAANLHPGTTLTAADLAAAAKRLADTGYFDSVSATIEGKFTAAAIKFDDTPTPLDHMLHVGFTNFVYLTHEEIEAAIHARFPLFIDYLPENSPSQDDIKAALTAALSAKSIAAEVAYDEVEPTLRHPTQEVAFTIAKPRLRVANIKLAGATPILVPLVQKSVNATARTPYTEGPADQTTADRILAPLLDAGYIQAALTDIVPTPGPATPTGDIPVVLSATLAPGDIYHVASVAYPGTPILSAESFAASAKLHPGDLASRADLLETLAPLDAAYRRQGYMDVAINAEPTLDATAHTVSYAVTVIPGAQYRLHEITPNNLDPAARADFDRGFVLKPGALYNPEYVAGFLKANTALRSLEGYSAGFKAYADPNTHTVDLVINFFRAAR